MKTNTYEEITVREAAFISGFSENWLRILISKEKAFLHVNLMEQKMDGEFIDLVLNNGCLIGDTKQRIQ